MTRLGFCMHMHAARSKNNNCTARVLPNLYCLVYCPMAKHAMQTECRSEVCSCTQLAEQCRHGCLSSHALLAAGCCAVSFGADRLLAVLLACCCLCCLPACCSYVYQGGQPQPVPASRADLFADRALSLADKRSLGRFMAACGEAAEGSGRLKVGSRACVLGCWMLYQQ